MDESSSGEIKMKVIIMAGGKGTRIASINSEVPKPMIPIMDKPILEYQIESLKVQGYTDLILVVGYLRNIIMDYFGNGSRFDINIKYVIEEVPLGTAGALYLLKDDLTEDFLLLNGDIIFDIDVGRFCRYHKKYGGIATLFTHPNSHPYDSSIIVTDKNGCIQSWLNKEDIRGWYHNQINAGIHMFSPQIFNYMVSIGLLQELKKIDLDRDILKPLISTKQLFAYSSSEYVKDMGIPERFYTVMKDIKSGKVQEKNLRHKQKAIFLDRDGTINKYVGFLRNIDDFKLLPGVPEAIRRINVLGYLAIVVTNQPVIARGEVTYEQLQEIHNKMETLLGKEGAYVDAIYYCPHHPHKGYKGEVPELKFECDCRKPKVGLLLKAIKEFNIDLTQSWIIGDRKNDIETGLKIGCNTALIHESNVDYGQSLTVYSLLDFTKRILK